MEFHTVSTPDRKKSVKNIHQWLIDWLKCVSLEFSCRNDEQHAMAQHIHIDRSSKQTDSSAHINAQILFSLAARLRWACILFFVWHPTITHCELYKETPMAFQRHQMGRKCNKNISKQKRWRFNHTASYHADGIDYMCGFFPAIFHNHLFLFIFRTSFFYYLFFPF